MKKKFNPSDVMPAPVAKWPYALLLSMGMVVIHTQSIAQTKINTNRTTEVTVNGGVTQVAPNVKLSVADWVRDPNRPNYVNVPTPVVTIKNNGSFSMDSGSQITAGGNRATDAILMQSGAANLEGASVTAIRRDGSALRVEGDSNVFLKDTNLEAEGAGGNALVLKNTDATVSVRGGSLTSKLSTAINIAEGNSTISLQNVDVSGVTGIVVSGKDAGVKTIHLDGSTLTATDGRALFLNGSNSTANLRDSKVVSKNGNNSVIRAEGSGNSIRITDSELEIFGAGTGTHGALNIQDGASAEVSNSKIVATGTQAYGVMVSDGSVVLKNVDISTSGVEKLHGVSSDKTGGRVDISGGSISTAGENSNGMYILGGSSAKATGTSINVAGEQSNGVRVAAHSTMDIRDSVVKITNAQSDSSALVANGAGAKLNAANVNVATVGNASGLATQLTGNAKFSGGSIETADGAGVVVAGGSAVTITDGASIRTTGDKAHAVHVSGAQLNTVTLDGVTLATGKAQADLIHVSGGTADLIVRNGAVINTDGNVLNLQSNGGAASKAKLVADGVNMTGNIRADSASTGDVFLRNSSALTGRINSSSLSIDGSSTWNVTGNSELTSLAINGGAVIYRQPDGGAFTTVKTGSLEGSGGRILMHAPLGDGTEPADFLHVTGDSTGSNVLAVKNTDGVGAQTIGDGIHLVQIDGNSAADNFSLEGGIMQAGLYEYFLKQGGQSRDKDWFLKSTRRAAVPGYLMAPTLNREFGYSAIGTLHERVGDVGNIVRSEKGEGFRDSVWGRIGGSHLRTGSSEQIEASARSSFMQFGKDWTLSSDANGASTHAGATVTLGEMRANFTDDKRVAAGSPLGRDTGTAKTRAAGVGAYWTKYYADGTYFDAAGQVTRYGTQYKDVRAIEASNKGIGAALSIEAGKPIASYGSMRVEAQGQLIYQYLRSDKFSDGLSDIAANGSSALRGRAGVRIFREMENGDTPRAAAPYATFNVYRNFSGAASVGVDGQSMQTQTNKTWGEIGVGITGRPSGKGMLYAGLKYRHQLGGLQFEGAAGEIGYRYSW